MKKIRFRKVVKDISLNQLTSILENYYLKWNQTEIYNDVLNYVMISLFGKKIKIDNLVRQFMGTMIVPKELCNKIIDLYIKKNYTNTKNDLGAVLHSNYRDSEGNENQKYYSWYHLDMEFEFGKHKGKTLDWVYRHSPTYVEYCIREHDSFIIKWETYGQLLKSNPRHIISKRTIIDLSRKHHALNGINKFYYIDTICDIGQYEGSGRTIAEIHIANPEFIQECIIYYSQFFITYKTMIQLMEIFPKFKFSILAHLVAIQKERILKHWINMSISYKREQEEYNDYLDSIQHECDEWAAMNANIEANAKSAMRDYYRELGQPDDE